MQCPFCHYFDTKVVDSRFIAELNSTKRRRKCEICEKRFNTFETIELIMPMVVKTDGRRETFSIEKIKLGIQKSCQKRPVSTVQIDHIVEQIEKTIHELGDKEISTAMIGRLVMDHLQLLDPVAYVRFASVYRNFQDVEEFVQNLRLENKNSTTVPKAEH